ncbi:MAG: hypothetical protein V4760_01100 [Bdellovibrionota bacterium]
MSFARSLVFLTFVVACCALPAPLRAAKSLGSPNLDETTDAAGPSENEEEIRKSIDIAPQPAIPLGLERRQEYFHKYRQALTAELGFVYDTKAASSGTDLLSRLGAQYMFTTEKRENYEAGAHLLSDGSGAIHFAQRKVYGQSRFRPFIKAGAGVRIVPADQLATFLKHENYQIRVAGGMEQLVKVPYGVRIETELMVSSRSQAAAVLLGVVSSF